MKNLIFIFTFVFAQLCFGSYAVPDGSITKKKLAPANIVISSSTTLCSAGSGVPSPCPNSLLNITTVGRPVWIKLNSSATGVGTSELLECNRSSGTLQDCFILIYRDGSEAARINLSMTNQTSGAGIFRTSINLINWLDTGASAGTHTYQIYLYSNDPNSTVNIKLFNLVAMEL